MQWKLEVIVGLVFSFALNVSAIKVNPMDGSKVRLFLIRHSETQANKDGIVLGQSDSPLTERGVEQARALGRIKLLQEVGFSAYYSSDLGRARKTANLILGELNRDTTIVHLEKRLREMAKGAREGFSKTTTPAQALAHREKERMISPIPFEETEDEAWQRMYNFVLELLTENNTEGSCGTTIGDTPTLNEPRNIFLLSHSGILRLFLQRLLGTARLHHHPNARFDKSGRFYLPNTSVTILDVGLRNETETSKVPKKDHDESSLQLEHNFEVTVVQLTWAEHLDGHEASSMSFAE